MGTATQTRPLRLGPWTGSFSSNPQPRFLGSLPSFDTPASMVAPKSNLSNPCTSQAQEHVSKHHDSGVIDTTLQFYKAVWYFLSGGSFNSCPHFSENLQARVQLYSLCLVFYLWNLPHYRAGTFQQDMKTNLRNVAIPGTGVPLSWMCLFKPMAYCFLLIGYPILCLLAAWANSRKNLIPVSEAYSQQLLCPDDWFSFWRLNCRLASFHAFQTGSKGYEMENKWIFLDAAHKAHIPVSPCLDTRSLVIKDKNEEGGMGIHFFQNARDGGDWIIQERLGNSDFLKDLLPVDAPLSTLRVITSSRGGLRKANVGESAPLAGSATRSDISSLSCVFRAGRAGALTDHSSLLFDVDLSTGIIKKGTTNAHWYQIGMSKVISTPWRNQDSMSQHIDTGTTLSGVQIEGIDKIKDLCERAHLELLPDVPLAGWDVALTDHKDAPMCLLEVNLSCNFFQGTFDKPAYFRFMSEYLQYLDQSRTTDQSWDGYEHAHYP